MSIATFARPCTPLLDDLGGLLQDRLRDRQIQGLRRLEIDDQLEPRHLLHGKIGRSCALQDLIDVGGCVVTHSSEIRPVGEECPFLCPFPTMAWHRETPLSSETENEGRELGY